MDDIRLEKFYVYRSLNNDESWGTVLLDGSLTKLPNVSFGMRIFAINETEAIARAKKEYDKIHAYDSDKENVRRFAAAALKQVMKHEMNASVVAKKVMKYSLNLLKEYNEHFKRIENEQQKIFSDNEGDSGER